MEERKRNLIGELRIMKDLNIKPNYSALQREYGIDRHTVKKYYSNDGIPKRKIRKGESKWDVFLIEIEELLDIPHVSYKAIWLYLFHKYGENKVPGDYHSLRHYLYRTGRRVKTQNKAHVLYETNIGEQAQFDWKEDLKIHLKNGEEINFNVFSLTLSYSREHVFIYSTGKTTDDLLHCLIKAINKIGGVCDKYLTDNMSAIVSCKGGYKKLNPRVSALFNDLNSKLKLCKAKTPETKGKDENANKFINWIYPYEYKLNSEKELINLIEQTITSDANNQINTATNLPPTVLFSKEKEYLRPLPNKILLDSYLNEHYRQCVPETLLINHKGNKYSVPSDYISKYVDIYPIGNELYIYYNSKLIAKHNISHDKINYTKEHYVNALCNTIRYKDSNQIEEMANLNLERLKVLGRRK